MKMAVQQRGGVMHDHDATPPSFGDVIEPGCWEKMEVLKAAVNIGIYKIPRNCILVLSNL